MSSKSGVKVEKLGTLGGELGMPFLEEDPRGAMIAQRSDRPRRWG